MSKRKTALLAIIALVAGIALLGIGPRRPWSTISMVHLADEKHIHQVFGPTSFTQRIVLPVNSVDGIQFFVDEAAITPPDTVITLHVRLAGSADDIRTVVSPLHTLVLQDTFSLYIPFEPITGVRNQSLDFIIEAPGAKQQDALRLRYQSDSEKYPEGTSFSSSEQKQGNLGFVLYERPTVGTLVARWLIHPQQRHVIVALAFLLAASVALYRYGFPQAVSEPFFWKSVPRKTVLAWIAGIIAAGFVIWWPATHQFYFHDDLALLARAEHFSETAPWKIVSAHDYVEADEHSRFDLAFWRPVSAGLFSSLIWHTAGLQAGAAYGINILLAGATTAGLFLVAGSLARSIPIAGIASFTWLVHATKIGTLFWWSSNHDILASLFGIYSLLFFILWRAKKQHWYLVACLGLYALAFLSKEHVLVIPIIALVIDRLIYRTPAKLSFLAASPYIITACMLLLVRALVFSDPSLPSTDSNNSSYSISLTPSKLGTNTVTYAIWSAENWLWPKQVPGLMWLENQLSVLLAQSRVQPPFYPGVLLLIAYAASLIVTRKQPRVFHLLVFGGIWWAAFLGPLLFFESDWRYRWLYLPIFGMSLGLAAFLLYIPKKFQLKTAICIGAALILYGAWHTRVPERTKFYREQAAYVQEASRQLKAQEPVNPRSRIVLIGVREDQTTSLNAYLFRLLGIDAPVQIERFSTHPPNTPEDAIVIDMTGKEAYYPGYEQ